MRLIMNNSLTQYQKSLNRFMTELEKAASLKEKADYKYSVSVEALKMLIEK